VFIESYIGPYRRIRHIGRIREWECSKVERRLWDDEQYPPPPELRYPGITLILGSWSDIWPSASRTKNRYSRIRGKIIEDENKIKRLQKRRAVQKYRANYKRTGQW
jgi:hypothetical protein